MSTESIRNSPFYAAITDEKSFYRYKLDKGKLDREFPIFTRLRQAGVTDYIVIHHSYGHTREVLWEDLPPNMEGVLSGFSTSREGGFTDEEIELLFALSRPLAVAVKNRTSGDLARTVRDTFFGQYAGGHVLNGMMKRGDGHLIDCVLWYCVISGTPCLPPFPSMHRLLLRAWHSRR